MSASPARRHRRAVLAQARRSGGVAYPEARGCVVCGEPFVGPVPFTGHVEWAGRGSIQVPLHAKCAAEWSADPQGVTMRMGPRIKAWVDR